MRIHRGPARRAIRKRRNTTWLAMLLAIVLWGVITQAPMMLPGDTVRYEMPAGAPVIVIRPPVFGPNIGNAQSPVIANVDPEQP